MRLIDTNSLPRAPWKNGGGETCTVAIRPEHAGLDDFDWRVSIADVRESGPFSSFVGVERIILMLHGNGMVLEGESGLSHALTVPFERWALRGEDAIYARLVDGAVRDFNVMVRRGLARAAVKVWRGAEAVQCEEGEAVLFCAEGVYRIGNTLLTAGTAAQIAKTRDLVIASEATDSVLIGAFFKS